MTLQYFLYVALAPVSIVVTGVALLYAMRHRISIQVTTLIWLMTSILGWLICNTLELIAQTEMWTMLWAKTSYIFIAITPVAWLAFALQYTRHPRWLSSVRLWILSIIPTLTMILAITNDFHHLLWTEISYVSLSNMLALHVEHGLWFWIFAVYSYILIFIGAGIISQQYVKPFAIYRHQSAWLLLGALVPVGCNLVYIFDLIPGLEKDYTPLSFAFAGIAFAVDVYQYRLFDLRPVARDLVIDSTSDAMITLDAHDRVVDLNPAAILLQEQGMDLTLGEAIEKLFESANLFYLPMDESTFQQDVVLTLQDKQRYFDMRSMPVKDRRGTLTGRLFILRDITKRKLVEIALRQQSEELAIQNRELDAFAHTVAHDLKGPMGTTVGYASMLREVYLSLPEDEFIECLEGIETSTVRMSQIVDALLLLSQVRKLEDVPYDALDMGTVVIRALDRVNDIVSEAGARFVLPPSWPFAMGYAPWVEEVWVNYISNAVKYSGRPEEGVEPVIELGWGVQDAQDDAGLRFWVRDNGIGLSAEAREKLFVEFTRLNSDFSEGHGLGLSIVKRIIDKLGGTVGVQSDTDEGNTFYFTLSACDFG